MANDFSTERNSASSLPIQNDSARAGAGMNRRSFFKCGTLLAGGCACCLHAGTLLAGSRTVADRRLLSPGCRTSKVRIAKIYLGKHKAHWPTPKLDLNTERARYEQFFQKNPKEFADVEFTVNELITEKEQVEPLKSRLDGVDGVLLIHLSMGVREWVESILGAGKPTMLFAAPYSGHEWSQFGQIREKDLGRHFDCLLTSDLSQLAEAVRPFRAIHHLREAKILNLTTRQPEAERLKYIADKFGTQIVTLDLQRVLDAYNSIDLRSAEIETRRWISGAQKVVEPPRKEIFDSCRLALAFEKVLDEENATVLTVDCYGTMYQKLPAFPCVGFVRLNDMGFAGICESDLASALTFVLFQGLAGRPGFISDPTLDESRNSIILAHCLGTRKMDGPSGKAAPYRLRTIMERQEGVVPQVFMRVGQRVTQAIITRTDEIVYFTGTIIETPDTERGCRTKITVKVDGNIQKLWHNWAHGLHRVTCYGDLAVDLARFCRFKDLKLTNEA